MLADENDSGLQIAYDKQTTLHKLVDGREKSSFVFY